MLAWLKQIFEKKREATASEVISAYGALLETYPGFIMDIAMLPRPKSQMKILLKTFYGLTSDPKLQSLLTEGFMSLADFQDGVGPNPVDPNIIPGDFTTLDPPTARELEEIKRFACEPEFSQKLERLIFWQQAAAKETSDLDREWVGFLNGNPINASRNDRSR